MRIIFLLITLLLFVASCTEAPFDPFFNSRGEATPVLLNESSDNQFYILPSTGTDTVLALDSYMVISLGESDRMNRYGYIERPDSECAPWITLGQSTEIEYSWANMSLMQEIELFPGVIQITHKGILRPDTIVVNPESINNVSTYDIPNGEYDLYFNYNDLTDHYLIDLNDSLITLTPIDTNYTRPGNRLVWRDN